MVNAKYRIFSICLVAFFSFFFVSVIHGETDIKKYIIGKWERYDPEYGGRDTIEFFKDETVSFSHERLQLYATGDYKFIDNNRIRIDLGGIWSLTGPLVCRISVTESQLIISWPDGSIDEYYRVDTNLPSSPADEGVKETNFNEVKQNGREIAGYLSSLEVTLDRVYFEKTWLSVREHLFIKLILRNTGRETLYLFPDNFYIQDHKGKTYRPLTLGFWLQIEPGEIRDDIELEFEIPKEEASSLGLKLFIKSEEKRISIPLSISPEESLKLKGDYSVSDKITLLEHYLVPGEAPQLNVEYKNVSDTNLRIFLCITWFSEPDYQGWKQLDERGPIPPGKGEKLIYSPCPPPGKGEQIKPKIYSYLLRMDARDWKDTVSLPPVFWFPNLFPIVTPRVIESPYYPVGEGVIKVANLSSKELSALSSSIELVLNEEIKLGKLRKIPAYRSLMLAGDAKDTADVFSLTGDTGIGSRVLSWPDAQLKKMKFLGVEKLLKRELPDLDFDMRPPGDLITIPPEHKDVVSSCKLVAGYLIDQLLPILGIEVPFLGKILTEASSYLGLLAAEKMAMKTIGYAEIIKPKVGAMYIIYDKQTKIVWINVELENLPEKCSYGWKNERFIMFIPFDKEPPKITKVKGSYAYRVRAIDEPIEGEKATVLGTISTFHEFIQPCSDAGGYYGWLGGPNKDHLGHDYNAPEDTEVKAIADGEVFKVFEIPAKCYDPKTQKEVSQPFVWIRHQLSDERYYYALYGHIKPFEWVKEGKLVTAGEGIGKILQCYVWYQDKLVPAPHLHFGIWGSESPPPTTAVGYGPTRSFTDPIKFLRVGTYINYSEGIFIELREDNTVRMGGTGEWKIEVEESSYGEIDYNLICMLPDGTSDTGYIEKDAITGLYDIGIGALVKQEESELIKRGQGRLWDIYKHQWDDGVTFVEFKEDGIFLIYNLWNRPVRWDTKGNVIHFYGEDEKDFREHKIEGNTLMLVGEEGTVHKLIKKSNFPITNPIAKIEVDEDRLKIYAAASILGSMRTALEMYMTDESTYPNTTDETTFETGMAPYMTNFRPVGMGGGNSNWQSYAVVSTGNAYTVLVQCSDRSPASWLYISSASSDIWISRDSTTPPVLNDDGSVSAPVPAWVKYEREK